MNKYFLLFSAMVLIACERDLDIDFPVNRKALTLNALFTPDSLWNVYLTASRGPLDTVAFEDVRNATVIVYSNDVGIDTLIWTNEEAYRSRIGKPDANEVYEVVATAPGFEPVSAFSIAPEAIVFTSKVEYVVTDDGPGAIRLAVLFQDKPDEHNFYEVSLELEHDAITSDGLRRLRRVVPLESDDPLIPSESFNNTGSVLFNDLLFNGEKAELTFTTTTAYEMGASFNVVLRSLSEDAHRYKTTLRLQQESADNPLAEPVTVHSNVSNGIGIFAGETLSLVTVNSVLPDPVITGFAPQQGEPGARIIVSGRNFSRTNVSFFSAFFDGLINGEPHPVPAQSRRISDTEYEVVVPPDAITGKIYMVGNGRIATSAEMFQVLR